MRFVKAILLLLLGLATAGLGLCGAFGVTVGFEGFMAGCHGQYGCVVWYLGWIGLGLAALSGLLFWLVARWRTEPLPEKG
jgi:hypothetical protein